MKTSYPQHSKRSAFTLIELLSVVAIIGILAAILIPAISFVRSNAAETEARSNLRQIGTFINLYTTQNGNFPYGGINPNYGWDWILVDSGVVEAEDLREVVYSPLHDTTVEKPNYPRSYSMTRTNYLFGIGVDSYNSGGKTNSTLKVAAPATTLLLAEKFVPGNTFMSFSNCVVDTPQQSLDQAPDRLICNYLFADGHVEALSPYDTIGENGTMSRPKGYWTVDPND